jgi:hypothetical protein
MHGTVIIKVKNVKSLYFRHLSQFSLRKKETNINQFQEHLLDFDTSTYDSTTENKWITRYMEKQILNNLNGKQDDYKEKCWMHLKQIYCDSFQKLLNSLHSKALHWKLPKLGYGSWISWSWKEVGRNRGQMFHLWLNLLGNFPCV